MHDLTRKISAIRTRRADIGSEDRRLAATQKELEAELIDMLATQGVDRVTADGTNYKLVSEPQPTVVDWDAFYESVAANKWFFLLHKRLTVTSAAELIEAGECIGGVEVENKPAIRYSKA